MMNVIELEGVSKRYGQIQALTGFDLRVGQGEVVGFLGPNGAGKSTAINIMLGLRKPSDGTARIFGLSPQDPRARARTGVMLQETGVPHSLRVEELVRLFQSYYPYTLPTDEILQRAGLTEKRRALIDTLSGGQKQRLYFALALAGDPDLLFLDEPTVGMDVEARHAFWEQVRGFAALGKTILFSTHYIEEADALASRVIVMQSGRILAEGSPQEIRGLVVETQVRLRTDLTSAEARSYPGVRAVQIEHGQMVVSTSEPEAFLQQVFQAGHLVAELSVQRADLEQAFLHMTEQVGA
jgi:ABC-2 type transport system ATP-binding protein